VDQQSNGYQSESTNDLLHKWNNKWLVAQVTRQMTCCPSDTTNDLLPKWYDKWLVAQVIRQMTCFGQNIIYRFTWETSHSSYHLGNKSSYTLPWATHRSSWHLGSTASSIYIYKLLCIVIVKTYFFYLWTWFRESLQWNIITLKSD
jgi:hypothetical protein